MAATTTRNSKPAAQKPAAQKPAAQKPDPKPEPKPEQKPVDTLLNLSEVARQLGRSQQTIKRWIAQDRILPAVRLPSRLLAVRQSDVNKFVGGTAIEFQER